ncbi:hypothetical protein, partial [Vibrio cholerae]|uniref:hypothetical protein n=1 Tax=Vibrio cholerae TaxID=666 RepID=UPI00209CF9EC
LRMRQNHLFIMFMQFFYPQMAGVGQTQVGEVGLAAWAARGFGNVQAQRCIRLGHGFLRSIL